MVLFWPIQQELDCISPDGTILGRIKYDKSQERHFFHPNNGSINLTEEEQIRIQVRIAQLDAGDNGIPMQDDD